MDIAKKLVSLCGPAFDWEDLARRTGRHVRTLKARQHAKREWPRAYYVHLIAVADRHIADVHAAIEALKAEADKQG